MDLIELGAVIGDFFEDGAGPSHDQLDHAFARAKLAEGDTAPGGRTAIGAPIGKTKRVRGVFVFATDNNRAAGLALAKQLVSLLRADGAFSPNLAGFAGNDKVQRLREAFHRLGFSLDANGALRPLIIDNLSGTELAEALRAYVDRINLNPLDAPLQVGTGKELDEAVARHVLVEKVGSYPTGGTAGSFPHTLAQAFTLLGFAVPPIVNLDADPHKALQQSLFLLATSVNRLRNAAGTGHGRPEAQGASQLAAPESQLVARAMALIAGAMLDAL